MSTISVGSVTRISTAADLSELNGSTFADAYFSPDGNKVVFSSGATNLVEGDTNSAYDVFIKDLSSGAITRVSVGADGTQLYDSYRAVFSPDGNEVAFVSEVDVGWQVAFLKNLQTGGLWQVTSGMLFGNVTSMDFSPDGHSLLVMYTGNPAGTAAFVAADLATGEFTYIDIAGANSVGFDASFSPDGNEIVYSRWPTGVYLMDLTTLQSPSTWNYGRATPDTALIDAKGTQPVFSPDGTKIAFERVISDVAQADPNGPRDAFVKDLTTGAITRISTGADGVEANGNSLGPVFSPDGKFIAFTSTASNLVPGDTNGKSDIFVKDLTTGAIARISVNALGEEANGDSFAYQFSPDGTKIIYGSDASNLVHDDINQHSDIFIATLQFSQLAMAGDAGQPDMPMQTVYDQGFMYPPDFM